jgi:NAD(P)-dependent dehydrogenase (short-subunit alcohol dehydrogenase family)
MKMRLKGKSAIITGVGDGIGRGIALAFAQEGANLAICDLKPEHLKETKNQLEIYQIKIYSKCFDVQSAESIKEFVKETATQFHGLNILVNNAAIMPSSRLETLTPETIDQTLCVNLKAPILFSKYSVPPMVASGGGSIINMASVTGHNGFPEVAVYGATKGGIISLSRGHAMELAPMNIRVNSVSPGTVDSPMLHKFVEDNAKDTTEALAKFDAIHPRGKVGSIDEIAAVFVFLASDESANITATDIRCDGGYAVQGTQPD